MKAETLELAAAVLQLHTRQKKIRRAFFSDPPHS
jgi:hypothetical protein